MDIASRRFLWGALVLGVLWLGFTLFPQDSTEPLPPIESSPSQDDAELPDDHDSRFLGTCTDNTMNSHVRVYQVQDAGVNVGGRFIGDLENPKILLVNTSLRTIAHEASHLVDMLLEQRGVRDEETEAYLQGFYTECIADLVSSRYR